MSDEESSRAASSGEENEDSDNESGGEGEDSGEGSSGSGEGESDSGEGDSGEGEGESGDSDSDSSDGTGDSNADDKFVPRPPSPYSKIMSELRSINFDLDTTCAAVDAIESKWGYKKQVSIDQGLGEEEKQQLLDDIDRELNKS